MVYFKQITSIYGDKMKYLIASDIHGSAHFCKLLIEKIETEKPDRIILLGDLLYHGPRNNLPNEYNPKLVIDMLNGLKSKLLCVRGNCEANVDQMVLEFPVMADYAIIEANNNLIFATHGHKFSETNPPPLKKGDFLLNGHTHVPKCTTHEDFIYLNPGSVSIPKENSPHSFMTFDGREFLWHDLENGNIYMSYKL